MTDKTNANTEHLRAKIAEVIEQKLSGELSCADIHSLAQAVSELERNDLFRTMTSIATMSEGASTLEYALAEKGKTNEEPEGK